MQRDRTARVHSPTHCVTGQVRRDQRQAPVGLLPLPRIGPPGVNHLWECLPATLAGDARIVPPLDLVHHFQPPLQFLRAVTGPGLPPPLARPLRALDHPIVLRTPRGIGVHPHLQPEQPQLQVRRQVAPRAPRRPVVHPQPLGPAPVAEGQSQLRLSLRGRDLSPMAQGGKPRSGAPRRCIRRRSAATRRADRSAASPARPRPFAKPREAAGLGASRRQDVVPPARGTARHAGTIVAGCERRATAGRGVVGATSLGSIRLPRSDGPVAGPRRLAPGIRRAWVSTLHTGRRTDTGHPDHHDGGGRADSGRCAAPGQGPRRWWGHPGRPGSAARWLGAVARGWGEASGVLQRGLEMSDWPMSVLPSQPRGKTSCRDFAAKLHVA